MKKNIIFLSLIIFIIFNSQIVKSQCQEYIEAVAEYELEPYILDGNFQARIVYEGDSIQITRTFLAGNSYKISVIGMDMFAKKITVTDQDGFIVYKNYFDDDEEPIYFETSTGEMVSSFGINFWEFKPEYSQNLKIVVEVEKIAKRQRLRLQGCLGVVIGFAAD